MGSLKILSSACVGIFVIACGTMWALGVFSGLSGGAVMGALFGIFLATMIGTALTGLAVYSDQSGHDEIVFHAEDRHDSRN